MRRVADAADMLLRMLRHFYFSFPLRCQVTELSAKRRFGFGFGFRVRVRGKEVDVSRFGITLLHISQLAPSRERSPLRRLAHLS